jgi:hypothetical protein
MRLFYITKNENEVGDLRDKSNSGFLINAYHTQIWEVVVHFTWEIVTISYTYWNNHYKIRKIRNKDSHLAYAVVLLLILEWPRQSKNRISTCSVSSNEINRTCHFINPKKTKQTKIQCLLLYFWKEYIYLFHQIQNSTTTSFESN